MANLKTPLRYPGGKSRATKKMAQFLPDMQRYKHYREPFLGGGSVALYMTQTYPHLDIHVNDLYEHLYNFWTQLQDKGDEIAKQLTVLKKKYDTQDRARHLFAESKEYLAQRQSTPFHRAISFYIINKCSFSGLTESSSFSAQASDSNFSLRGIDKLPEYQELIQNWKITNESYENLLTDSSDTFVYMDPPYDIKSKIYGKRGEMHKTFDHDKFAGDCDGHTSHMMISYNSSQINKNRFTDWNAFEFDLTYTMRSTGDYLKDQSKRKELILTNYGLQHGIPTQGLFEFDQSDQGIPSAA